MAKVTINKGEGRGLSAFYFGGKPDFPSHRGGIRETCREKDQFQTGEKDTITGSWSPCNFGALKSTRPRLIPARPVCFGNNGRAGERREIGKNQFGRK